MAFEGRLISDPFHVELVRHRAWDDKATLPGWVEFDQYQVYVHSEGLRYRNPDCKLMVGYIGTQPGANFCAAPEFLGFTYPQQQKIAEDAKKLHGNASDQPHVPLPPPLRPDELDADPVHEDGDEDE